MLPKSGVELYVDGNRKTVFSYNRFSGALSHAAGPLKEGRHSVRIRATDPDGRTASRHWISRVEYTGNHVFRASN